MSKKTKTAAKCISRPCWEITHTAGAEQPFNAAYWTKNNKQTLRTSESYHNRADAVKSIRTASDKPILPGVVEIAAADKPAAGGEFNPVPLAKQQREQGREDPEGL